jgi:hypothetical protein
MEKHNSLDVFVNRNEKRGVEGGRRVPESARTPVAGGHQRLWGPPDGGRGAAPRKQEIVSSRRPDTYGAAVARRGRELSSLLEARAEHPRTIRREPEILSSLKRALGAAFGPALFWRHRQHRTPFPLCQLGWLSTVLTP